MPPLRYSATRETEEQVSSQQASHALHNRIHPLKSEKDAWWEGKLLCTNLCHLWVQVALVVLGGQLQHLLTENTRGGIRKH